MEDDLKKQKRNGRQPQQKLMEDNLKKKKMEDDLQKKWKTTSKKEKR